MAKMVNGKGRIGAVKVAVNSKLQMEIGQNVILPLDKFLIKNK